jgi:heat shock protein HslJ
MKKALFYLIIFASMVGCSSEKDNNRNSELVGNWKLEAFVNEENGTIVTASDFENSNEINIEFKENNKFEGYTGINDFHGIYSMESKELLIINEFYSTYVGENEWGNLFFDSLDLNYNISTGSWESTINLSNTILKIYYSENEYMEFEKM